MMLTGGRLARIGEKATACERKRISRNDTSVRQSFGDEVMEMIEFTDRYRALGIPYPNPATICKGQCEGTGWVLLSADSHNDAEGNWGDLYREAHNAIPWWHRWAWSLGLLKFGGWHFVRCPRCNGTKLEPK